MAGRARAIIEEVPPKRLVLGANILLRAMLGSRVRILIEGYSESTAFYSPEICFDDARKYNRTIAQVRSLDPAQSLAILENLTKLIQSVAVSSYVPYEETAQ